jgi:hypothetical protein
MATPREIQKQVTRPTSAVIMMLLWEAFIKRSVKPTGL